MKITVRAEKNRLARNKPSVLLTAEMKNFWRLLFGQTWKH